MALTAHASGTKTATYGTFTVTIASPGVFSMTNTLAAGDAVVFSTTGALPTGLTAGTTYYVIATGLSGSAFQVSTTVGGSAVNTTGSQSGTHTVIAEHSVSTAAVAGVYVYEVDTNAMVSGDALELRIKRKVLTGGTARTYLYVRFDGQQPPDDLIKVSVPVNNDLVEAGALDFTLRQVAGTGRAFPWKVQKHA